MIRLLVDILKKNGSCSTKFKNTRLTDFFFHYRTSQAVDMLKHLVNLKGNRLCRVSYLSDQETMAVSIHPMILVLFRTHFGNYCSTYS